MFPGEDKEIQYEADSIVDLEKKAFHHFTTSLNTIRSSKGLEAAIFMEIHPSPHFHLKGKKDGVPFDVTELYVRFFQHRVQRLMQGNITII